MFDELTRDCSTSPRASRAPGEPLRDGDRLLLLLVLRVRRLLLSARRVRDPWPTCTPASSPSVPCCRRGTAWSMTGIGSCSSMANPLVVLEGAAVRALLPRCCRGSTGRERSRMLVGGSVPLRGRRRARSRAPRGKRPVGRGARRTRFRGSELRHMPSPPPSTSLPRPRPSGSAVVDRRRGRSPAGVARAAAPRGRDRRGRRLSWRGGREVDLAVVTPGGRRGRALPGWNRRAIDEASGAAGPRRRRPVRRRRPADRPRRVVLLRVPSPPSLGEPRLRDRPGRLEQAPLAAGTIPPSTRSCSPWPPVSPSAGRSVATRPSRASCTRSTPAGDRALGPSRSPRAALPAPAPGGRAGARLPWHAARPCDSALTPGFGGRSRPTRASWVRSRNRSARRRTAIFRAICQVGPATGCSGRRWIIWPESAEPAQPRGRGSCGLGEALERYSATFVPARAAGRRVRPRARHSRRRARALRALLRAAVRRSRLPLPPLHPPSPGRLGRRDSCPP